MPQPLHPGLGWSEHRIGLLAHLIGDGCVIKKQPVHYTSNDPENLAFVEAAAAAEFGISPRRVAQQTWWHVYLPAPEHCTFGRGNPIHDWFRELGIEYLGARAKRLPEVLYSATDAEIGLFLRHLWATDGCVWIPRGKGAAKVYYASSSRELADGVARLLARLGIVARIRQVEKAGYEPGYHVIVADGPSLRAFCAQVGVHGRRGETARELAKFLADRADEHQCRHGAAWRVGARQVRTGPRRAHREAVPGRHRDELLRHHALQELPVARAADAMRGRARF